MPNHPPGPPNPWAFLGEIREPSQRRLDAMRQAVETWGDIVSIRLLGRRYYLINHPDLTRAVLVDDAEHYHRTPGQQADRARVLEMRKVTREREDHRRIRRIVQPAMTPARLHVHVEPMRVLANAHMDLWQPGQPIDIADDMSRLTIRIAARCLFDADTGSTFDEFGAVLKLAQDYLSNMNRAVKLPIWVPTRDHVRLWTAWGTLTKAIRGMVASRRAAPGEHHDVLESILTAADETDGARLTDKEAENTMIGLLIAGHETTATLLTWTLCLLAGHPEAEAALHHELDSMLAGRDITPDDLPRLPYVDAVIRESMRLYPPAWVLSRRALAGAQLAGYAIDEGAYVFMSPYLAHRDARFYSDPDAFRPERWLDGLEKRIPRYAYFPFGGGSHICTGQFFAWLEAQTLLAALCARWRFVRADDEPVMPRPLITMFPANPVPMLPLRRHT
jgi:cytochrome P450